MAETSDSDLMETSGGAETNGATIANTKGDDVHKAADGSGSSTPKKTPVKCQACTSCRLKKIRCDGKKPMCSACVRSASDCLY
ncbi:hypothetical protein LPJ73_008624, partial [Coemansia sp. RSA 2703]